MNEDNKQQLRGRMDNIPLSLVISAAALVISVIAAIVIKSYMPRKICLVAAIISAASMVLIYRKNEDVLKSNVPSEVDDQKDNKENSTSTNVYSNASDNGYINPIPNIPLYEQTTVLQEEGTTVLNDCIGRVFKESRLEYIDDSERQIYGGNITIREDNTLIGSSSICDYVIDNQAISRSHARISRMGGKYYITDLNSTNGTFINGIRMNSNETRELNDGEEVMIGRIRMRFVSNLS